MSVQAITQPIQSPRKLNWQQFQTIVNRNNVRWLYHFTDRRNLNSIRQHRALFSWIYCDNNGITIPFPASNDLSKVLDVRKGLQDFVRLSFNPRQPMMFVVPGLDAFVLEVLPEVIYWQDTQFSNVNATANNALVGPSLEDFQRINLNLAVAGNWTTQEEKALIQAEVLVKTKIPIEFIRNI